MYKKSIIKEERLTNNNVPAHLKNQKPKFLFELETSITKKVKEIKKPERKLLEDRRKFADDMLQVYRQAFSTLLSNIKTFKPLLISIKDAYEESLSARDKQIDMNNIIMRVVGKPKKVENNNSDAQKRNENEILNEKLRILEDSLVVTRSEVEKLKSDSQMALSAEVDIQKMLSTENVKLKQEIQTILEEKKNHYNNAKDPVILNLALDNCRKDLSKAIKELNSMSEDYVDAVPKKDYEMLESDHIVLLRDFSSITIQMKEISDKYDLLLKKYTTLQEESAELRERCSDMTQCGTPRPQWDICADFIGGGSSRWKELTRALSSRERLRVILRELGPAAQTLNLEYFDGLGLDPVVPPYLQYEGQIRNLRLSRRELSIMINDIWSAKEISAKDLSMQDFLSQYFFERYQQSSMRAEWAYNLYNGCEQMLDDQQIKLFWGVLSGSLSQELYFALKAEWRNLRDQLTKTIPDNKNVISMDELEKAFKASFPMKSDVDIKNLLEIARRQLKIKMNAVDVDIEKLFSENEEGFERIDLAKELQRQRQVSQEKYIREVINKLGGKKNPNNLISVENLKRAFVIIDPHIDHIKMEANIRWVFSDKRSNLNMMYPITLKVLAAKLSSGNIERVGPRIKGKIHKLHRY